MNIKFRIKIVLFTAKTGINQTTLAKAIGVTKQTITGWKKERPISYKNATKLVTYAPEHFTLEDCGW